MTTDGTILRFFVDIADSSFFSRYVSNNFCVFVINAQDLLILYVAIIICYFLLASYFLDSFSVSIEDQCCRSPINFLPFTEAEDETPIIFN